MPRVAKLFRKPKIHEGVPIGLSALRALCLKDKALRDELLDRLGDLAQLDWCSFVQERTGISLFSKTDGSTRTRVSMFHRWMLDRIAEERFEDAVSKENSTLVELGKQMSIREVREMLIARIIAFALEEQNSELMLRALDRSQSEQSLHRQEKEHELKAKALDQAERKLVLMEQEAAKASETDAVLRDSLLTPEQRKARLEEIYQVKIQDT